MTFNKKEIISKINIFYWVPIWITYPIKLLMVKTHTLKTTFLPSFGLFHKLFAKDFTNIFFAFIYPTIFLGILGLAMPPEHLIAGMGAMVPSTICCILLPQQLVELKKSSLMKKIGSTKIQPWMLNLTIFIYYFFIVLAASFSTMGLGIAIWKSDVITNQIKIEKINWGGVVVGIIFAIMIFLPLGLFIASIAKNPRSAQLMGLILTVPLAFLSGQFLPLTLIQSNEGMRWTSYFLPQRFPTQIVSSSFIGPSYDGGSGSSSPFNLSHSYTVLDTENDWFKVAVSEELKKVLYATHKAQIDNALSINTNGLVIADPLLKKLAIALPFVWMTIFWTAAIKTFKWGIR